MWTLWEELKVAFSVDIQSVKLYKEETCQQFGEWCQAGHAHPVSYAQECHIPYFLDYKSIRRTKISKRKTRKKSFWPSCVQFLPSPTPRSTLQASQTLCAKNRPVFHGKRVMHRHFYPLLGGKVCQWWVDTGSVWILRTGSNGSGRLHLPAWTSSQMLCACAEVRTLQLQIGSEVELPQGHYIHGVCPVQCDFGMLTHTHMYKLPVSLTVLASLQACCQLPWKQRGEQ
ncbi:uncharacterized protein LOC117678796 isoform X2 [Pantherophis guttatus]|uniref:Uncharacterized protein LOC117678796 isoform X2 n=1 Tax=Pantherophis guttatus TaxID=94885 RepID=A0ABM3YSP7_PANGU|nr:uncharacterized protein LOC117678796 isoform X2 [Pantherophis guttatus]XP_060539149.1 uncharacterized protein LOC117678796 isoform X2 [Pantherophis guttatus]